MSPPNQKRNYSDNHDNKFHKTKQELNRVTADFPGGVQNMEEDPYKKVEKDGTSSRKTS